MIYQEKKEEKRKKESNVVFCLHYKKRDTVKL